MKICVAPGCEEIAAPGQSHCAAHGAAATDKRRAARAAAQTSPEAQAGRRLYRVARWKRKALDFLDRNPLCRHCAEMGITTAATDVDHVVPHRGDPVMFWKRSNWQPLCHSCHSRKTAGEVFHGPTGG